MTHPGGRPPFYNNPDDMQVKIEDYFTTYEAMERPFTVIGLAYHLGFADTQTLNEYGKKEEFSVTVKRAKARIEQGKNEMLLSGKGNTIGLIFDLKNNHGWRDRQDIITNDNEDISADTRQDQDELKRIAKEVAQLRVIQGGKG